MILQRGGGARKDGTFGHDPRHIFTGNYTSSCCLPKSHKIWVSLLQICHLLQWWIGHCL